MPQTYELRRSELTTYFDRTAAPAWEALTSDAPVSRIRATVRAGRDEMRALLLSMLPGDMTGLTLLDAGCGTGALTVEAARRGARVTAVDVSPRLIATARERLGTGATVDWRVGDMLDPSLGRFDCVVAMDSLIHYREADILDALAALTQRTDQQVLFTVAPLTPLLAAMHAVGRLFPQGDKAPAIEPVASRRLTRHLASDPRFGGWTLGAPKRVTSGFYLSEAYGLSLR